VPGFDDIKSRVGQHLDRYQAHERFVFHYQGSPGIGCHQQATPKDGVWFHSSNIRFA
jgi:hypothetical protein